MKIKNQLRVQVIHESLQDAFPGINHYRNLKRLVDGKKLSVKKAFKKYSQELK